jgi:transposase
MPFSTAVPIELAAGERAQLELWVKDRSTARDRELRCRIVLAAAEGQKNVEIAERLRISPATVRKWRRRFAQRRLDGLRDEPRPGRPRTVDDRQVEEVIARTLESAPAQDMRWSTRSLAVELGLSQSAVHRIWKAFGLGPRR